MKQRRTVRKLKDLLPEVLIEAQGCDEITATAALRRSVEELCQSRGFGEVRMKRVVREGNLPNCPLSDLGTRLPLERQNVLRVCSVAVRGEDCIHWVYDDYEGAVYLPLLNVGTAIEIVVELMPDVDEDVSDIEAFTKWRHLVIAKALEDLFSMTNQSWANPTRYQIYADRARRYLEDYLSTEKYYKGDARARMVTPPMRSVFY